MPRKLILTLGLLGLTALFAGNLRAEESESISSVEHRVSAAEHGGEVAPPPKILELKPELAITTLIVFGLLFLVLRQYAWGPLSKALSDREHHIERALLAAESANAEGERLLAAHRAQMEQAAEQVRALIDQARRDAAAVADQINRKALADADAARERAERDIATARDQALLDIYSKAADLAVTVAGKVLKRELNESDHRRLVEVASSELPSFTNGKGNAAS
jgi:F-type H+-transporting ATPase subunit b